MLRTCIGFYATQDSQFSGSEIRHFLPHYLFWVICMSSCMDRPIGIRIYTSLYKCHRCFSWPYDLILENNQFQHIYSGSRGCQSYRWCADSNSNAAWTIHQLNYLVIPNLFYLLWDNSNLVTKNKRFSQVSGQNLHLNRDPSLSYCAPSDWHLPVPVISLQIIL